MRTHYFVLSFFPVVALAWWAYSENYETKLAAERVKALQSEIGSARESLNWLYAEWAYLNRPERIAALVDRYFDDLQLVAFNAGRFGSAQSIPLRQSAEAVFDHESELLLAAPLR